MIHREGFSNQAQETLQSSSKVKAGLKSLKNKAIFKIL